jgi:hypothetical protein
LDQDLYDHDNNSQRKSPPPLLCEWVLQVMARIVRDIVCFNGFTTVMEGLGRP